MNLVDNLITQVKILKVDADNQKRSKIDADIPEFSTYPMRFITWPHSQGEPPKVGETGLAELKATSRQPWFIKKEKITEGEPDGSEPLYMLNWEMVAFPVEQPDEQHISKDTGNKDTLLSVPSKPPNAAVFLDANLRYRTDMEGVNDRKAVSDILTLKERTGIEREYTVRDLIAEAEYLAAWYNSRNAARLSAGMVGAAQEMGAVVTKVKLEIPEIKNSADLTEFTKDRGWSKEQIEQVLDKAGFKKSPSGKKSADYLAVEGNSVMGLAKLLVQSIDG